MQCVACLRAAYSGLLVAVAGWLYEGLEAEGEDQGVQHGPEYISIISVDRRNGIRVIEFMYLFRRYVAKVDKDGRVLALKSRSMPLVGSPA